MTRSKATPPSADPTDAFMGSIPAVVPQTPPEPQTVAEVAPTPAPVPFTRSTIPLSFEEAQSYSQLASDSAEAKLMLQSFQFRHPDSAWLAARIRMPLETPGDYERLAVRPWNDLLEARRIAQEVAKGRQLLKLEGHGINADEIRAVRLLGQEMPIELEALAADLGKRGEKAAWMVKEARRPDPFDRPVGEHTVKDLSERWSQRVSAFKLIAQLEKQGASPKSALTFAEARSLDFLRSERLPEAEKLAELLEKRHPNDGWMARELLSRKSYKDEFTTQDFHYLENQAKERQQAHDLLAELKLQPQQPADWNLTQAEAEACWTLLRHDPEAAASLQQILSGRGPSTLWAVERHSRTGSPVEELKVEWQSLQAARQTLQTMGETPFTQAHVDALRTLAVLSPDEAKEWRSSSNPWIADQVVKGCHSTEPPLLENLQSRFAGLERAERTRQAATQWEEGSPLVSWSEVDALQTWRREYSPENYARTKELLSVLKARHADASWFYLRLEEQRELTPESYQVLLSDYGELQKARETALRLKEQGGTALSLEEANCLLTLKRLGPEAEYESWRNVLTQRGSAAQLAISLLPSPQTGTALSQEEFAAVEARVQAHGPALALHQNVTSTEQKPIPEGPMPYTLEEIAALLELQDSSWALAHSLRQALGQRSDFVRSLPSQRSEWRGELEPELRKYHDCWLLGKAAARLKNDAHEGPDVRDRVFYLGSYELNQPLNLTTPAQAESFVRTWCRLRERTAPDHVAALARLPGIERVSAGVLNTLLAHLKAGGTLAGLDAEKAAVAARGWDVDPHLPLDQALERGAMPLAERLNGGPGPFKKSELVQALLPEQLPLAIELTQGRSLSPDERLALYSGLRTAPNPNQALLDLKGAAFREALQALKPLAASAGVEGELTPHDYRTRQRHSWEERGAAALALTFRGSWKQWLDAQARIRGEDGEPVRSLHDVVDILPLRQLPGLDAFLLKNSHQKLPELSQVIGRWEEIAESERGLPFDEVLALARSRVYPQMVSPEFGAEAAKWGIPEQLYPELEERYLASQQVASPFAGWHDRCWKSGELTGRFLPRQDVRGLFLGHHTGCCQHPSGAGATCAYHGQESPRGGFFVLENAKKEIVVQSWAWVSDEGGLVFDNVEGITASNRPAEVRQIYQAAADELAAQFPRITLGLDHGKLPTDGWPRTTAQTMADFDGYSDAENQVLLKGKTMGTGIASS